LGKQEKKKGGGLRGEGGKKIYYFFFTKDQEHPVPGTEWKHTSAARERGKQ